MVSGQYLLADSAYELTSTVIPAYKAPAANITINSQFNYCVAKARVRNEHTIGVLKSRWYSLREMRLHLYRHSDMREYVAWLYSCIILHNLLAGLGDQWTEIYEDGDSQADETENAVFPTQPSEDSEDMRNRLTMECVKHNISIGVLPA